MGTNGIRYVILLFCVTYARGEVEKGNVQVLPSVSHTLIPATNSSSDGHNNTIPSIFPIYDTNALNSSLLNNTNAGQDQQHDTFHHHGGQWGKEHAHNCSEHERNKTCDRNGTHESCVHAHGQEHTSSEKVEQILWDIFTEEMEDDDDEDSNEEVVADEFRMSSEESEPETEVVEEVVHDELNDSDEKSSNEINSKERSHVQKRSAPDSGDSEKVREGRKNSKGTKKSNGQKSKASASASTKKYNEYMDVVLKRMNTMIKGKNMDPLMVNLFSGADKKKKNGNKNKNGEKSSKGKGKGKKNKNNRARMETDESDEVELDNDHELSTAQFMRKDLEVDEREVEHEGGETNEEGTNEEGMLFRNVRALILNGSMRRSLNASEVDETGDTHETRGFDSVETGKKNGNTKSKNGKKPAGNKETGKNKNKKQQATRGILKGLSSLRRTGNVDVIRQGDKVRIVRSKFLLGPVMLEIVPKNSQKRTPKAQEASPSSSSRVTAVASQLKGIIEVRLKKNSPTTIKRLRVFPPSSVKIKSSPNSKAASVPRYSRVTPVATHRLRQIASAVVRQADLAKKTTT